jgi:hypothetical protein
MMRVRGLTDGHGQNSTDGKEVERGDNHGGFGRVFSLQDGVLGEEEDDTGETGRDTGSDDDTTEDSGNTLGVVPSPLDCVHTTNSDTGTGKCGNDRIRGRDG